jgi:5'-nucleotidase / UDP-sugar diphosphatase
MTLGKRSLVAASLLAAALSYTACEAEKPVKVTGQVHLTLLHTSDIHSRLFPYDFQIGAVDAKLGLGAQGSIARIGGAAKISHVLGRERARAERVLHLDGGDCFQGAPVFNFFNGEAEIRALSEMGTDAMIVANHEFDKGPINLGEQLQKWSTFPILAANYKTEDLRTPGNPGLGRLFTPWTSFNLDGLKVGVIGMGNLSTISSLFETPNSLGITPLNTEDVAQFYIDLIRPFVDVVVFVTHLGLEYDERMIANTSGIDVVLGGHNHIVLQPAKQVPDCARVDENGNHYIRIVDPSAVDDEGKPFYNTRRCNPRNVLLAHSGAFARYVGRLDLILSDDPADVGPGYDPLNRFELISNEFKLLPITNDIPDDPRLVDTLLPYKAGLDALVDLDLLVGYAPGGVTRTAPAGGDSPLGNMVATSVWLRQGIQTDFSLTNTTGIRAELVPGPVTLEAMYNVFPFDNSISKMQLSGTEVQQMFDFTARRATSRGCVSQVQIAGARVVYNCLGCTPPCTTDDDCPGGTEGGVCETEKGTCKSIPCAERVYIGRNEDAKCKTDLDCAPKCDVAHPGADGRLHCAGYLSTSCKSDADCKEAAVGSCDSYIPDKEGFGRCGNPIDPIASYELATSNYLASGGSGFSVLKRNTTQFDTGIQQRDALIDWIRQGRPCGWDPAKNPTDDGLAACKQDEDCGDVTTWSCACTGNVKADNGLCKTVAQCGENDGRCVYRDCRDSVAAFHRRTCDGGRDATIRASCEEAINPCELAGEECKFLACVDQRVGNFTDNRLLMLGR